MKAYICTLHARGQAFKATLPRVDASTTPWLSLDHAMQSLPRIALLRCIEITGEPMQIHQGPCLAKYYKAELDHAACKETLGRIMRKNLAILLERSKIPLELFNPNVILCGDSMVQATVNQYWHNSSIHIVCADNNLLGERGQVHRALCQAGYSLELQSKTEDGRLFKGPELQKKPNVVCYFYYNDDEDSLEPTCEINVIAGGSNIKETLNHFTVIASRSYWDGKRFYWPEAPDTFYRKTSVDPMTAALIRGFVQSFHPTQSDLGALHDIRMEVLRCAWWKKAMLVAIANASSFYEPQQIENLQADVLLSQSWEYHFHFMRRQMSCVTECRRNGFSFPGLPALEEAEAVLQARFLLGSQRAATRLPASVASI